MEKSYEKISPTAKMVAQIRTFTDIPYTQEIAAESGAEKVFQELADGSVESIIPLVPLWEARYKATDRIIKQIGITQILEIAAGLSPRGLAMTENPEIIYVTTDLPEILDEEKKIAEAILSRTGVRRPNLHFLSTNALDRESLARAATIFRMDRTLAIITEGLLSYFSRSEKDTLARNIHELLRTYPGVWITPDTSTRQSWGRMAQTDEAMQRRLKIISGSTGRDLESTIFADENEVNQFFLDSGFKIQEYNQAEVLDELSSIERLNLDLEKIRSILSRQKTFILTPRPSKE